MTETLSWLQILVLAIVQGIAELLPVSSSAHVIVAEKLMGLDPTKPEMTLLLVMLHTGTMFAVILYFWTAWKRQFFASKPLFVQAAQVIVAATVVTGVIGLLLKELIEKVLMRGSGKDEIEQLFGNHWLIAGGLAAAGILIIVAGYYTMTRTTRREGGDPVRIKSALWIGAVQGFCLPVRGFSRSGATVSTGLLVGVARDRAEAFSFALAVVLTPAVIVREGYRFYKASAATGHGVHDWLPLLTPSLVGMVFSFFAGLVALRWLSRWLEAGRWQYFGFYCLVASALLFAFGGRFDA
jgi:undecaprenyl-diphosphatase